MANPYSFRHQDIKSYSDWDCADGQFSIFDNTQNALHEFKVKIMTLRMGKNSYGCRSFSVSDPKLDGPQRQFDSVRDRATFQSVIRHR